MVGIAGGHTLSVPTGYVSDTFLSGSETYSDTTVASLGVTPGTYVMGHGEAERTRTSRCKSKPPVTNQHLELLDPRLGPNRPTGFTIAGFIISGTGPKSVVVRGLGSTLAQPPFNVPGVLADPTLQLFDSGGHPFWFNDNWKDTQQAQIQSTGLAAPNDLESAILQILEPGSLYRRPFWQKWHHRSRLGGSVRCKHRRVCRANKCLNSRFCWHR